MIKAIFMMFGLKISNISRRKSQVNELNNLLGFPVDSAKYEFLYRGLNLLRKLKELKASQFSLDNESIYIKIDNLNFKINSWEEILILNEVFVEGIYNFEFNEDFTLIDIGMNVGITSLFFANKSNCKQVFSYEPFLQTFKLAHDNLKLNKNSTKIMTYNYGLGFPERNLLVNYNLDFKGSVGINGLAEYICDDKSMEIAEIEIRDAGMNILKNLEMSKGKVIIKIDCEGAEYEILRRLSEMGLIGRVSAYIIEWHINGPSEIIEVFKGNAFEILSFKENSKDIGMIYAFKKSA